MKKMSTPLEVIIDLYYDGWIDQEEYELAMEEDDYESNR